MTGMDDDYQCPCCGRWHAYDNLCSWCINKCKGGKHTPRK